MKSMQGILFDLDGTLWDSSEQVIAAWNDCIAETTDLPNRYTLADMQSYMGKTMEVIAALMFPCLPEADRMAILHRCTDWEHRYLHTHPATLYPESERTLRTLAARYRLGIVSNCQEGYIPIYLAQCGFAECFCDQECAGHTGRSKGENIRQVMARQGITDCIYVGDTAGDEEAARDAGIPFVHAAYVFGTAQHPAAVLHALQDLPELAAQLLR